MSIPITCPLRQSALLIRAPCSSFPVTYLLLSKNQHQKIAHAFSPLLSADRHRIHPCTLDISAPRSYHLRHRDFTRFLCNVRSAQPYLFHVHFPFMHFHTHIHIASVRTFTHTTKKCRTLQSFLATPHREPCASHCIQLACYHGRNRYWLLPDVLFMTFHPSPLMLWGDSRRPQFARTRHWDTTMRLDEVVAASMHASTDHDCQGRNCLTEHFHSSKRVAQLMRCGSAVYKDELKVAW